LDEDDLADLRGRKIGFVFESFNLVARTSAAEAELQRPRQHLRQRREPQHDGLPNRQRRLHAPAHVPAAERRDRRHRHDLTAFTCDRS
jgi:putative ABC transport system ATP-binding protein